MPLNPEQIEQVQRVLEKLAVDLQKEIEVAKASSKPVELDQQAFGRVSRIDAIQQQKMSAAGLARLEQRLQRVKAAKTRVNNESFGLCSQCEEEIPLKRLLLAPEVPVCVKCAG